MVKNGVVKKSMKDRIFIDSNIFVYTQDENDINKKNKALSVIQNIIKDNNGVISTQVLQEFNNVITKKLKFDKLTAKNLVETLSKSFPVQRIEVKMILKAIDISIKTQFSFWDSLILSAAIESNCNILYSEDLNAGQVIEGIRIENPIK